MSPIDAAIVRRKLGHIMTALDALRPLAHLRTDEYRARLYERKAAERLLQEAIEAALDINAHLIAELGREVPEDSLAPSAGLLNRLVHEYDTVDDAKVLGAIATTLELYPRYIQAIEAYLGKAGLSPTPGA